MISLVLFWFALVMAILVALTSLVGSTDTKSGILAFPFALLLAAAIARYLGM